MADRDDGDLSAFLRNYGLKEYGRFGFSRDGKRTKYTALDPATETFRCGCGKPECFAATMSPFREHIARLYRAIATCDAQNVLKNEIWRRVLYSLQMAASIEDVHADTAFVDDTDSISYCSPAADFEAGQTEMASKYAAAASIFSFLWTAYEIAVQASFPHLLKGLLRDGRMGERGRRLFAEYAELFPDIEHLESVALLAERLCERGNLFGERLARIRARELQKGMTFSAELAREFRNFVVHGEDEIPQHEAWGGTPGEATARIRRFYAIGRLVLLLIQTHASAAILTDTGPIEHGLDDEYEPLFLEPRVLFERLHLLHS